MGSTAVEDDVAEAVNADVCIMGAGPVGGALACRLSAAGVAVAVIDSAPLPPMEHPAFDGRAYAIAAGSVPLLEAAGLWERLVTQACPIESIRVSDGRLGQPPSPLHLSFDTREAGEHVGPFGWMVEARALRVVLNERLHALPWLHVFAPASADADRRPNGVTVRIADGPTVHCRLLVAADGRDSPLREAAGIPITRLPYSQTSIVCAISHERPHGNVALEHFLPSGPFAQLPMAASTDALVGGVPHVSAIVWTERTPIAKRALQFDDARFAKEIARRLGGYLGELRVVGRRWSYPLSAMLVHRFAAARLALVGDAAHAIHPVAGQGLNLGFRDAIALADLIVEQAASGADPGSEALLLRSARRRRADILLMLGVTDGLNRLFSTDWPPLRLVRDLGMAAVDRTTPLKRVFIRQAMGIQPSCRAELSRLSG